MRTKEWFLLCLVLTPFLAVLDGGIGVVCLIWILFAYKAYMNQSHQEEVDLYKYMRDHITFKEERAYHDYYADMVKKNEKPKTMMEWYIELKKREFEDSVKEQEEVKPKQE